MSHAQIIQLADTVVEQLNAGDFSQPFTAQRGYLPTFDVNNLDRMGYFRTATGYIVGGATKSGQYVGGGSEFNTQNFYRDEVKIVFSQYLDFKGHSHLIKAGFGYDDGSEYLERIANGWGSIIYTTYSGQPAFRARYYPRQDPQKSRGRTYSLFIQDSATIGDRLTVLVGLLANRDEFITETYESRTFLKFDFGEEIQPRLGFTYILDKNAQDKIYANFGRYYCMDNKSLSRAWAPLRIYRRDAYFNTAGVLLADNPQASETGKVILPGLKPTYQDEFVVGYSRPLTAKWFVDLWGQYRYMKNMAETVDETAENLKETVQSLQEMAQSGELKENPLMHQFMSKFMRQLGKAVEDVENIGKYMEQIANQLGVGD